MNARGLEALFCLCRLGSPGLFGVIHLGAQSSKAKAAECNGKIAQEVGERHVADSPERHSRREYLRAVALGKAAANEPSEIFHSFLLSGSMCRRCAGTGLLRSARAHIPALLHELHTIASETRPVSRPTASVATRSHGVKASGSREMTVAIEMPEPIPAAAAACAALSFSMV